MSLKEPHENVRRSKDTYVFVVLGASGSLAKKEIFPSLWANFRNDLLPEKCYFLGFGRSNMDIIDELSNNEKMQPEPEDKDKLVHFLSRCFYLSGSYSSADSFMELDSKIREISLEDNCHRVFHLALPSTLYTSVTKLLSDHCKAEKPFFTRLIIEKPFGKDLQSAMELSRHLAGLYNEKEIYRIDHYLGKEIVQNLILLRFANRIFEHVWSRNSIQSVMISFKETLGVEGRGGFFDEFGIIRDIMQNHMMQILALVAMEAPQSICEEDISKEKIKVLKCVREVEVEHSVIGQYIGNKEGNEEEKQGYTEDESVADDSNTPTFACTILQIDNERWFNVPFIFYCGKALSKRNTEVRIQFKPVENHLFSEKCPLNEFVLHVTPDERVTLSVCIKEPGFTLKPFCTQLDLCYKEKLKEFHMPEAYERLLLDVFNGDQLNFTRTDEIAEAWRIFTPLLEKIESNEIELIEYLFGSEGIPEADDLCQTIGKFKFEQEPKTDEDIANE